MNHYKVYPNHWNRLKRKKKMASPKKTAHILVSQMEWHEPLIFEAEFLVFPFKWLVWFSRFLRSWDPWAGWKS